MNQTLFRTLPLRELVCQLWTWRNKGHEDEHPSPSIHPKEWVPVEALKFRYIIWWMEFCNGKGWDKSKWRRANWISFSFNLSPSQRQGQSRNFLFSLLGFELRSSFLVIFCNPGTGKNFLLLQQQWPPLCDNTHSNTTIWCYLGLM